jgi:hypothetical protein
MSRGKSRGHSTNWLKQAFIALGICGESGHRCNSFTGEPWGGQLPQGQDLEGPAVWNYQKVAG